MKAIILVGGYGTRLRPLTFSTPKPLVPFCNKAIMLHQLEALAAVGVSEVVLAVNVRPAAMEAFVEEVLRELKVKLTISLEDVPMGTAGPLALARAVLEEGGGGPFFMFNSDVICEFPLQAMLDFHRAHGGEGTIMVTPVEDPSKYGVVLTDDKGQIQSFVEKPSTFVSDQINAGLYLFNTEILGRVPNRPTSIEREIFPAMAADKQLYAMRLPGYWMDIGQPMDFLAGTRLHLQSLRTRDAAALFAGAADGANAVVHPTATLGQGCHIGDGVVVGPGAVVGDGARLERCAVFEGAKVGAHASVENTIVGWRSSVGPWANLKDCVLGEDVKVASGVAMRQTTVCPHKGVKADILTKTIVL